MAHYSEGSLETAACLWEAVLALRSRPITDPDAIGLALAIGKTFDALGTAALRLTVVGWTDAVEASWREVENDRSEEHTSELQSLMRISYAVLCLKKKTSHITQYINQ